MAHAVSGREPGLIIGGTGSNSGKTVTTLALLCALKARGLSRARCQNRAGLY